MLHSSHTMVVMSVVQSNGALVGGVGVDDLREIDPFLVLHPSRIKSLISIVFIITPLRSSKINSK